MINDHPYRKKMIERFKDEGIDIFDHIEYRNLIVPLVMKDIESKRNTSLGTLAMRYKVGKTVIRTILKNATVSNVTQDGSNKLK